MKSTSTISSLDRIDVCQEWVTVCTSANIPLSKTDHPQVRKFLDKHVLNGAAIPSAKQLQDVYLHDVYDVKRQELCDSLKKSSRIKILRSSLMK